MSDTKNDITTYEGLKAEYLSMCERLSDSMAYIADLNQEIKKEQQFRVALRNAVREAINENGVYLEVVGPFGEP